MIERVDHLTSELVTKRHGPTVVHEQSRLDARPIAASGPSTVAAQNRGIGAFGEQRDDIEELALLFAEPRRTGEDGVVH